MDVGPSGARLCLTVLRGAGPRVRGQGKAGHMLDTPEMSVNWFLLSARMNGYGDHRSNHGIICAKKKKNGRQAMPTLKARHLQVLRLRHGLVAKHEQWSR